jgi:hypothetical protein
VYFDLFGWSVVYSGFYTILMVHSLVFLLGLHTAHQLYLSTGQHSTASFTSSLLSALGNELYCLSLCLLVTLLVSLVMSTWAPMLWYESGTVVAFLLYLPPTLLTSAYIRSRSPHLYSQTQGVMNILAMWLLFLAVSVSLNLMVGYVACLHIISIWAVGLGTRAIAQYMAHRAPVHGFDKSRLIQSAVLYAHELCQLPIMCVWWSVFSPTFTMVLPLMGKVGTVIPSDVLVALLIAIAVCTGWSLLTVNTFTKSHSFSSLKGYLLAYAVLIVSLALLLQPYSTTRPKRLWIQHISREIHHRERGAPSLDHGLWVAGFDATGLDPIMSALDSVPYHRNQMSPRLANLASLSARDSYSCDGWSGDCYFLFPFSFPVAEALQDFLYIPRPSEPPPDCSQAPNKLSLDISLISSALLSPQDKQTIPSTQLELLSYPPHTEMTRRILCVTLTGSSHMTLILRELEGAHLLRWAFIQEDRDATQSSASATPGADEWHDSSVAARPDGVFYLQIGFGICSGNICKQRIYLETIDEEKGVSKLEVAAYAHYMEGRDETLDRFIGELPDWARGAEWSQYQSSLIVKYV